MPAPRPRFRVIGKFASAYMPATYKRWQEAAAAALNATSAEFFEGPVEVAVECYVTKPRTSKLFFPKPDVDNYAKAVLDAITKDGRFWRDDTQVVRLDARKEWADGEGCILITIKEL